MNNVENYGWTSTESVHSSDYIDPTLISILKHLGGERVLDMGSGNGALCRKLSQLGYDMVGMDNDSNGVELAQTEMPNIPFFNLGVQDSPSTLLNDQPAFDVVVSTEVIEHLYSPHLLPQFAHGVLKSQGSLIISTPYHGYLKNLIISLLGKWDTHMNPLWHGGHIKLWSKRTLSTLLEDNGFDVKQFAGVGRAPFFWKSMILVATKR